MKWDEIFILTLKMKKKKLIDSTIEMQIASQDTNLYK